MQCADLMHTPSYVQETATGHIRGISLRFQMTTLKRSTEIHYSMAFDFCLKISSNS